MGGDDAPRGTGAPWRLPWASWRSIAQRLMGELAQRQISLNAAGVAFFSFLAIFPALAVFAAVYGLVFDPSEVAGHLDVLPRNLVPPEVLAIVTVQFERLAASNAHSLSLGAVAAFFVALWSANQGMRGLISATNLAYDEIEQRSWVRVTLVSLVMTLGSIVVGVTLLVLAAGVPVALSYVGVGHLSWRILALVRWPALALVVAMATLVVYALAPNRKPPRWRWLTPGSVLATTLLMGASGVFSAYVQRLGHYNETYGSLGAVAIFLLWLYLGGYAVLLGAELNAEVEWQAAKEAKPR